MKKYAVLALISGCVSFPFVEVAHAERSLKRSYVSQGLDSTIHGRLHGSHAYEYVFRASAGQTAQLSMRSTNSSGMFVLYAPGVHAGRPALLRSGIGDLPAIVKLSKSGDYRLRVYLPASATSRMVMEDFSLRIHFGDW